MAMVITVTEGKADMFSSLKRLLGKSDQEFAQETCIRTDIHSHLLPGIDDGVGTFEESIELIRAFSDLGYQRLITTPHVMQDFYRNKASDILQLSEELKKRIKKEGIPISLGAAAEYYLDEGLMEMLDKDQQILTFGKNYLLFETSFINKPMYLEEFIFKCTSKGLIPVLAHPERYAFIHHDPSMLEQLKSRGVLLQVNANSITGYYSKDVKKLVRKMIDGNLVDFVGSDCHSLKHMNVLRQAVADPYFRKACDHSLLNDEC